MVLAGGARAQAFRLLVVWACEGLVFGGAGACAGMVARTRMWGGAEVARGGHWRCGLTGLLVLAAARGARVRVDAMVVRIARGTRLWVVGTVRIIMA